MINESFDSIYRKHDDEDSQGFYRYEYIVFDGTLVHPEYLVDFTFDDSRE